MSQRDDDAALVLESARTSFWENVPNSGWLLLSVLTFGQWAPFIGVLGTLPFGVLLLWSSVRSLIALALGINFAIVGTSSTAPDTEAKFWKAKGYLFSETLAYGLFVAILYRTFWSTS